MLVEEDRHGLRERNAVAAGVETPLRWIPFEAKITSHTYIVVRARGAPGPSRKGGETKAPGTGSVVGPVGEPLARPRVAVEAAEEAPLELDVPVVARGGGGRPPSLLEVPWAGGDADGALDLADLRLDARLSRLLLVRGEAADGAETPVVPVVPVVSAVVFVVIARILWGEK